MITQISMLQSNTCWLLITRLGSSNLLLPIMAIALTSLWLTNQKKLVYLWAVALGLAIALTVMTKLLFMGWGIGIASLDFTGVSGHTLLATSIFPILFFSVYGGEQKKIGSIGLWLGLLLSFLVGISRVIIGAHSVSEVIAGWVLGLMVSVLVLNSMQSHKQRFAYLQLIGLICVVGFGSTTPNYLPAHGVLIKLALFMSGHDKPYSRSDLMVARTLEQAK
jgi:membrane-associated phospholipid phosphatase